MFTKFRHKPKLGQTTLENVKNPMQTSNSMNVPPSSPFRAPRRHGFARQLLLCVCMILTPLLACPNQALTKATAQISALGLTAENGTQTLVISLSSVAHTVHSFVLTEPRRLVLDIAPAQLAIAERSLPADNPLVQDVRAAQFNPQTVRVVLDLNQDATHQIASHPPTGDQTTHQIVVSLRGSPATPPSGPDHAAQSLRVDKQIAHNNSSPPSPETKPTPAQKIILFDDTQAREENKEDASPWGELKLSGFFMAKGAHELHDSGEEEQDRMFRNTIRLEGKWTPPATDADLEADPESSSTFLLGSLQSDYLWFGPEHSSEDHDLELYEGYLSHATPTWDLRLGRQIVRWGKADQISPVDNINPQDLREFILPDLEERKIPNWIGRIRLFPGDVVLEGVFIPFFESNEFDFSGNTWALLGSKPSGIHIRESKPAKSLDNADWGVRTATSIAGWDVALSYLYATEKSPHLRFVPSDPKGPTLYADYKRQHIAGWEFETTLDKFGFRGEGAYFDRQSLPTGSLNTVAKPVAHSVLGVDYIGEQDWYANVQFAHQHVFEYDSDILFLERDNFFANIEINREFWRGHTMLKLDYALNLRDGGSLLTPEVILTYYKNLELSLGANIFFGPADSLFGHYRDNDQAFLKATYFF